ncbi:MAG: type II secretion system protein [Armatimonadota bacterium]|nr:type II secretion system protein [Armatimonadota bacterium]
MKGFTLLEVLMALAILGIALIGIAPFLVASTGGALGAFPTGFQAGRQAKDYIVATEGAQAIMEHITKYLATNWSSYPEGSYLGGSTCPRVPTPTDLADLVSKLNLPSQFSISVNIQARSWTGSALGEPTCTSPGGAYVKQIEVEVGWGAGGKVNLVTFVSSP